MHFISQAVGFGSGGTSRGRGRSGLAVSRRYSLNPVSPAHLPPLTASPIALCRVVSVRSRPLICIAVFATLMHVHLYPLDNPSQLLTRVVGQPAIVHAVSQVLIALPTGRALPKEFFGSHVGVVVLVVRDF